MTTSRLNMKATLSKRKQFFTVNLDTIMIFLVSVVIIGFVVRGVYAWQSQEVLISLKG